MQSDMVLVGRCGLHCTCSRIIAKHRSSASFVGTTSLLSPSNRDVHDQSQNSVTPAEQSNQSHEAAC